LKNKLRKLRAEFVAIQRSLTATGNDTAATPDRPPYFADMLVAFGDLHGLGDVEFGLERPSDGADTENQDSDAAEEAAATAVASARERKRKVEVEMEVQRQRQGRKKHQPDLAAGLDTLGKDLARGMVEAAKLKNAPSVGDDQMAKLLVLMDQTKSSLDKVCDASVKLLEFIQSKF
jgi:hypothetical protein